MNFKFSLIVLLDEFDEFGVKNCFNSVLHQSLRDIEIIFVSPSPLDYLKDLAENDDRIVILSSEDKNLKNIGLNYSSGEYVSFINCDDWIDFDYCEKAYSKAKNDDADILIYKLLEYEHEKLYDNYFYEFFSFDEELFKRTFTFDEIIDSLFTIPQSIDNKIYRTDFLKENSIQFIDNISFDEMIFFFQSFLNAEKISLLDDYIYFKKINTSNIMHSSIIKELFDAINRIFSIFKENNYYKLYRRELFNYKFDLTRYWYLMLNEITQKKNFNLIKSDLLSIDDSEFSSNPKMFLSEQNLFFYETFIKFNEWEIIDLFYKNTQLKHKFNESIEINHALETKMANLSQNNVDLVNKTKSLDAKISELYQSNEELIGEKNNLESEIVNLEQRNVDFVNKTKSLDAKISELYQSNEELIGEKNNLEQRNVDFVNKNDSLDAERNVDLVNKNNSLGAEINNLCLINNNFINKNKSLESDIINLKGINDDLIFKLDDSQNSFNSTLFELNEKINNLTSLLNKQSIIIARLNEKNEFLCQDNNVLREKFYKNERSNFKSKLLNKFY